LNVREEEEDARGRVGAEHAVKGDLPEILALSVDEVQLTMK
jgi:hypothetical protein